MTSNHEEQHLHRLPVRERRTVGVNGGESILSTVDCLLRGRPVPVADCERCARFLSFDFDPISRVTAVKCRAAATPPGPAGQTTLRDAVGLIDPRTPLADIMTRNVACVRADIDVQQVKTLLFERGIAGVIVVDEREKPIGVISHTDLLRFERERDDVREMECVTVKPEGGDDLGLGAGHRFYDPTPVTACAVMIPVVFGLPESASLGQAAALMAFEGVDRLPILSSSGEVVGILSALDVLRWLGRRSGYLLP